MRIVEKGSFTAKKRVPVFGCTSHFIYISFERFFQVGVAKAAVFLASFCLLRYYT